MLTRILAPALACALAMPAAAQVVDGKTARAMMFSTKGQAIQLNSALSNKDAKTIKALIPLIAQQMREPVRYYATIAYSPDEGLVSDALQAALNYNSTDAADAAALAACNKVRKSGTKTCAVAARVVPKGYKPEALTMSLQATEALEGDYRKARDPKAFAISKTTGAWGFGASDQAAVAQCAALVPGTKDCQVVVRN